MSLHALPTAAPQTLRIENSNLATGFTSIPNAVLRSRGLSRDAKLLYGVLLSYAWQSESCFPGYAALMADLQCGREALAKYIRELKASQLIEVKRRGQGRTSLYTLKPLPFDTGVARSSKTELLDVRKPNGEEDSGTKTQVNPSKFEIRTAKTETMDVDGDPGEQGSHTVSYQAHPYRTHAAGAGKTDAPEQRAVAPQDAPHAPLQAIPQETARTRPLSDPTAKSGDSDEVLSDPPAGEGFERLRATVEQIRQKVEQERGAGNKKTGSRQAEPAAPTPAAASAPPPPSSESGVKPSKRGRPPGSRDERQHIAAYLGDWLPQFNDQAPQNASITRAYNALKRANVAPELWGDYLHEAKSILREHQANVTTKAEKQTNTYQPKNLTPYYFAVLEDLLGLRLDGSSPTARTAYTR